MLLARKETIGYSGWRKLPAAKIFSERSQQRSVQTNRLPTSRCIVPPIHPRETTNAPGRGLASTTLLATLLCGGRRSSSIRKQIFATSLEKSREHTHASKTPCISQHCGRTAAPTLQHLALSFAWSRWKFQFQSRAVRRKAKPSSLSLSLAFSRTLYFIPSKTPRMKTLETLRQLQEKKKTRPKRSFRFYLIYWDWHWHFKLLYFVVCRIYLSIKLFITCCRRRISSKLFYLLEFFSTTSLPLSLASMVIALHPPPISL